MGCLWCCFGEREEEGSDPTARTPLLKSGKTGSSAPHPRPPPAATANVQPVSARRHRTEDPKQFLSSIEKVTQVEFGDVPVNQVNKTFHDHERLYNDVVNNYEELTASLHEFKSIFVPDTAGIPVLASCLQVLRRQCGDSQLTAKRSKYSLQVEYDADDVRKHCTMPSANVLQSLELLNKVARFSRLVLERAPQVQRSIQLVTEDEENMRKLMTETVMSPIEGPEAIRTFKANLAQLRRLPEFLETLQRHTDAIFRELLEASRALFQE